MSDALEDDLPVAKIIACRPNGTLEDEFVVTVICPYSKKATFYGIDGKKGDEIFQKVNTKRSKRRSVYEGDEDGFYIEGTLT